MLETFRSNLIKLVQAHYANQPMFRSWLIDYISVGLLVHLV